MSERQSDIDMRRINDEKAEAERVRLRDEFAKSAIEGIIQVARLPEHFHEFAEHAYLMADELLKARKEG